MAILATSSFLAPGAAHFFSVDIVDFLANSGNVSDSGDFSPEPAGMLLIGTGLCVMAALFHQRAVSAPKA